MKTIWKKGRGKLGALAPLLGTWHAESESEMGPIRCTRSFEPFGSGYILLTAIWEFGERSYRELCLFGPEVDGSIHFWSFTTDGKKSEGLITDASDIHPEAIGFVANMPAGVARQIYWPDPEGFRWAVESQTKKGWNRFTEHTYRRIASSEAD